MEAQFEQAAEGNAAFEPALSSLTNQRNTWGYGNTAIINAEATQLSSTLAVEAKLDSMSHKPDVDTPSPLDSWENTIEAVAPKGGTLYKLLLPHGRETLTGGKIDNRVSEMTAFTLRLTNQTAKPTLVDLGNGAVGAFRGSLETLRHTQELAKARVEELRGDQEALRLLATAAMYSAIGLGMQIYKDTPERVDELFDVNLLRGPGQEIPTAPIDTAWDAATRTLSTTEMPMDATHLVAYRQGEGGAPELLAGGADELTVGIPASFTFDPGEPYDLWLVAKNSRGMSPAGPVVIWTVPL